MPTKEEHVLWYVYDIYIYKYLCIAFASIYIYTYIYISNYIITIVIFFVFAFRAQALPVQVSATQIVFHNRFGPRRWRSQRRHQSELPQSVGRDAPPREVVPEIWRQTQWSQWQGMLVRLACERFLHMLLFFYFFYPIHDLFKFTLRFFEYEASKPEALTSNATTAVCCFWLSEFLESKLKSRGSCSKQLQILAFSWNRRRI